jgi:hypothetical protein
LRVTKDNLNLESSSNINKGICIFY